MIEPGLREELLEQVSRLPYDKQRQVLEFAAALSHTMVRGMPGSRLLKLAGTLPPEDAEEMCRAIEEDCERIDPDGW
jgi:hypothetical protein